MPEDYDREYDREMEYWPKKEYIGERQ